LHTRVDCAGVRFGGEITGNIETISWKKKKILVSGGQQRSKKHLFLEKKKIRSMFNSLFIIKKLHYSTMNLSSKIYQVLKIVS